MTIYDISRDASNSSDFSFTQGCLFQPFIWCEKQWSHWAQFPKPNDSKIGAIIQKIVVFAPLVLATFVASFFWLAGFFISGCIGSEISNSTSMITGSKVFIEKTFDFGSDAVNSINLSDVGNLLIEWGDTNSLVIRAEDNLLDFFSPKLKDHQLTLKNSANVGICLNGISYTLKLVKAPENLIVSGAGKVRIPTLTADRFRCDISGSGKVAVEAGKVMSQVIILKGAGDYKAINLQTDLSKVIISGAGSANVRATSNLDVTISEAGKCTYAGTPKIVSKISGAGSLSKQS